MKKGTLYLFPVTLGESSIDSVLPGHNTRLISEIKYFIVEDVRTARRFLKKSNPEIQIDDLTFFVLNQHTENKEISTFIEPAINGHQIGLLSEAGCPAIADPGSDVVAIAQAVGIQVVPLVGPSSILLALMASGFNGQSFAFNGYLPIQPDQRLKHLKKLEQRVFSEDQSQIFIETPYRNMKMLEVLVQNLQPNSKLCIAADITLESEFIQTKTIKAWKNNLPDLNKRPCIFIVYK